MLTTSDVASLNFMSFGTAYYHKLASKPSFYIKYCNLYYKTTHLALQWHAIELQQARSLIDLNIPSHAVNGQNLAMLVPKPVAMQWNWK